MVMVHGFDKIKKAVRYSLRFLSLFFLGNEGYVNYRIVVVWFVDFSRCCRPRHRLPTEANTEATPRGEGQWVAEDQLDGRPLEEMYNSRK